MRCRESDLQPSTSSATSWICEADTFSPAPHVLAGALCVGLGGSLAVRLSSPALGFAAFALAALALAERRLRLVALAAGLLVAGLWWGSVRLEASKTRLNTPQTPPDKC